MGSVGVVLDSPGFDNDLRFEERAELFDVQQFVADAAVEALDVRVFPWTARFDVADPDAREPTPLAQRVGDELGAVVATQRRRCAVDRDEPFELSDQVLRGAVPTDAHHERLTRVLVDDVRDLQPAQVGGLVEAEVDRPHVVRAQRPLPFGRVETYPASLSGPLRRPFQAFGAPQALHPLAVHLPAVPTHHAGGHLVPPPWVRLRDRTQLRA